MADSDSSSQRPRELSCRLPRRHKGRGGKSGRAATYTPYLPLTPPRRKINTSPTTVEDKEVLKKLLTTPPVKKIDLHFPLGLEVTARNLKGVTIKDALDAIHKQFKKRVSGWLRLVDDRLGCTVLTHNARLMTSWTCNTLPASSGTRRSRGPG